MFVFQKVCKFMTRPGVCLVVGSRWHSGNMNKDPSHTTTVDYWIPGNWTQSTLSPSLPLSPADRLAASGPGPLPCSGGGWIQPITTKHLNISEVRCEMKINKTSYERCTHCTHLQTSLLKLERVKLSLLRTVLQF